MKSLIKISIVSALLFTAGCQTATQLSTLATPGNVQASITLLGAAALPKVTAADKAVVHQFANGLLALTAANVDASTVASVVPAIPASASSFVQPLIQTGLVEINLALAKFNSKNQTVLNYVQAVGNGLIGAGF